MAKGFLLLLLKRFARRILMRYSRSVPRGKPNGSSQPKRCGDLVSPAVALTLMEGFETSHHDKNLTVTYPTCCEGLRLTASPSLVGSQKLDSTYYHHQSQKPIYSFAGYVNEKSSSGKDKSDRKNRFIALKLDKNETNFASLL